jgi:predicted GNAT family N-acyltransferase
VLHEPGLDSQLTFKIMSPCEEGYSIIIASEVFNEFVAPQYSVEGVTEFYKYANVTALEERSKVNHFTIIANHGNDPVGIIEIKNNNRISFFLTKQIFKENIGKQLLQYAIGVCSQDNPGPQKITVNASPNSSKAYEKMGFTVDNNEQCINDIKFVPMSLELNT